jgi:hypothetical protein
MRTVTLFAERPSLRAAAFEHTHLSSMPREQGVADAPDSSPPHH